MNSFCVNAKRVAEFGGIHGKLSECSKEERSIYF